MADPRTSKLRKMKISNKRTLVDVELKKGIGIQVALYGKVDANHYYLSAVETEDDFYDLNDDDQWAEFALIVNTVYNEEITNRLIEKGALAKGEKVDDFDTIEYVIADAVNFAVEQKFKTT